MELARRLKDEGVDLFDCSSGGNVPHARIPVAPDYQVFLSEKLRREAGVATAAVGMITEAAQADAVIREGRADLVLLARELFRDPVLAAARRPGVGSGRCLEGDHAAAICARDLRCRVARRVVSA